VPRAGADREWVANTGGVIDQLERDVVLAGSGGTTMRAARQALQHPSNLYTILVAYTDFGGCDHMVSAAGTPAARFVRVERSLAGACTLLQRAALLFTQAVARHDARALLSATRTTLRASPLLVHARTELDRLRET
jgi:succinate dehydrogenase/fumarate reductase flavoprotein subunit